MLQSKQFWLGVIIGVGLYYLYSNHLKGKGMGNG